MKKMTALFLLAVLLLSAGCTAFRENPDIERSEEASSPTSVPSDSGEATDYEIESEKRLKMYSDVDVCDREMTVTMFAEHAGIAYVEAGEFFDNYLSIVSSFLESPSMSITGVQEGDCFTATRESGATCRIDAAADRVTFSAMLDFYKGATAREGDLEYDFGDRMRSVGDDDICLVAKGEVSYAVNTKSETVLDLAPYRLDIVACGGRIYLPFQLFSNLLLSPVYQTYVCFDDGFFLTPAMCYSEEYLELYNSQTVTVTDELLAYNYDETCFFLDSQFGLTDECYGMSFDGLFQANGLKEAALQSVAGYDALIDFATSRIIDDGHTAFLFPCPLNPDYEELGPGASYRMLTARSKKYRTARKTILGETVTPYVEMGDTAFITFDSFDEPDFDIYEKDLTEAPTSDSTATYLFAYAYRQITRENSPIENIVIDITCNGGGDTRSLVYILGFFMDEVVFCTRFNADGRIGFSGYQADCNLDHVIDENDKLLLSKHIYVIESGYSYSCANLFTEVMGQSGAVMLGEQSGGGSSMVQYGISAVGTVYQFSGNLTFLHYKNGVYETIDSGRQADYPLTTEQIYNRTALAELLRGLRK